MKSALTSPEQVVSAAAYNLILTSPKLSKLLLPEGLLPSPYKVINYQLTVRLLDTRGLRTSFERRQVIQFQQNGVGALLDHAWGDGVLLSHYDNDAGRLGDALRDGDRRHLVVQLPRATSRGDLLAFNVKR